MSAVPFYCTSYINLKFYPDLNGTLLGFEFTDNHEIATTMVYTVQAFSMFSGFMLVLIFTFILIYKLGQKNEW
jgi:hypothetical protein